MRITRIFCPPAINVTCISMQALSHGNAWKLYEEISDAPEEISTLD